MSDKLLYDVAQSVEVLIKNNNELINKSSEKINDLNLNDDNVLQLVDKKGNLVGNGIKLPNGLNDEQEINVNKVPKLESNIKEVSSQLEHNTNEYKYKSSRRASSKSRTRKTLVTFITDDARLQDYTLFKDIFNSRKVPCCTAVISEKLDNDPYGTFCTEEQLLELQNEFGWEMLSHTKTHPHLTELTDSDIKKQCYESRERINKSGLKCRGLCVPFGFYDSRVKKIASEYFDYIRQSNESYTCETSPVDTFGLQGVWITNASNIDNVTKVARNTFEHYKWFIDKAYETNAWLIISTHSWEIEEWGYKRLFEQIIDYAKSKAEIVTVSQAYDYFENTLESGEFVKNSYSQDGFFVGVDGSVSSKHITGNRLNDDKVGFSTEPQQFENGMTTYCNIKTINATNFPNGIAGTLITYAYSQNKDCPYYFQIYKLRNDPRVYMRYAQSSTSWSAFKELGGQSTSSDSIVIHNNTFNASSKPNEFTSNKMTISEVITTTGTPTAKDGIMITYKFIGLNHISCMYQTFISKGSQDIFTRSAIDVNSWSSWKNPIDSQTVQIKASNSFSGTTPITEFNVGVTMNLIPSASASTDAGLPSEVGGVLTTYRIDKSSHMYNYQTYRKYRSNEIWTRYCDGESTWGSWAKITVV